MEAYRLVKLVSGKPMIIRRLVNLKLLLLASALWTGWSLEAVETKGGTFGPPPSAARRLESWRRARFGMFVDCGPASVNGTEISWSHKGHPFDHLGHETVAPEMYDDLHKQFNLEGSAMEVAPLQP